MNDTRRQFLRTAAAVGLAGTPSVAAAQGARTAGQVSAPYWAESAVMGDGHQYGARLWQGATGGMPDLAPLKSLKSCTVAEIEGPAAITGIQVRYSDPALEGTALYEHQAARARGVILEVYYNGINAPAVRVPLGDFFGDGCCGQADYFTTLFVEKAPGLYRSYMPMPFAAGAKVVLKNEATTDLSCFVLVEFDRLPVWDGAFGYLHATWRREESRVRLDAEEGLFHVEGQGHLLGRTLSVSTDEASFADLRFILDSAEEVLLDGSVESKQTASGNRLVGGLGQGQAVSFNGQYEGINLVAQNNGSFLNSYQFRRGNALRFNRGLDWRLRWGGGAAARADAALQRTLIQASAGGGGWADWAATFYWYQRTPGYEHGTLRRADERMRLVLHPTGRA